MSNSNSSISLLPPNDNPWLRVAGELALYNETLLVASQAVYQHTIIFGLIFLFRSFSAKRALDLHFLTMIFALSLCMTPFIFLVDQHLDSMKLAFFLEHEAVEFLLAVRVLAPPSFVKQRPGLIVFLAWMALSLVTVAFTLNDQYHHGAEIVAWGAFTSDSLIAVTGTTMIVRWARSRYRYGAPVKRRTVVLALRADKLRQRKEAAEAMAGLGFVLHGAITVSVAPIFALVLYDKLRPAWFAYAWVAIMFTSMFGVALSVPVAAIFFSTINCCCWHDRKTLPGEARWNGDVGNCYDEKADLEMALSNALRRGSSNMRSMRSVAPSPSCVIELQQDRSESLSDCR